MVISAKNISSGVCPERSFQISLLKVVLQFYRAVYRMKWFMQYVVKPVGFIGHDTLALIHTERQNISQQRCSVLAVQNEFCLLHGEMTRERG